MDLLDLAGKVHAECVRCGLCAEECAFLRKYGLPGDIAKSVLNSLFRVNPFECSLCQLCTEVCPEEINPHLLFPALRNRIVSADPGVLTKYRRLLVYERLGGSSLFSLYRSPQGCRSIFFPGCSISGTRPRATMKIYQELRKLIPDLGVVLDCCSKPSLDLGNITGFRGAFQKMMSRLKSKGIKEVIVACPSCLAVFKAFAPELSVKTAWELLPGNRSPGPGPKVGPAVYIHDPCTTRFQPEVHTCVRRLIQSLGLKIREMPNSGANTLCCGEGGAVGFVNRKLAATWGDIRKEQAGNHPVIVYCAGCAGYLDRAGIKTIHLGDLLVDIEKALEGRIRPFRTPWTYWNRLRLKRRFVRTILK